MSVMKVMKVTTKNNVRVNYFMFTANTSSLNIDIDITDDSLALPGFCQSLETVLRQGLKGDILICDPMGETKKKKKKKFRANQIISYILFFIFCFYLPQFSAIVADIGTMNYFISTPFL